MFVNSDNPGISDKKKSLIASALNAFQKKQRKMENKTIITKIFRIEPNNYIISQYFCVGCINFMLKGKNLSFYFCNGIWR